MNHENSYFSQHFTLEEIGKGIFAANHKEGGAAIANAGLVDLGDSTLVFDSFISPAAAKDLRKAADTVIGKPVSYVFNSHYHNDHIRGNQEFQGAEIISTAQTLHLIQTAGMEELTWDQTNAPKRYQHFLSEMEKTQDNSEREWLQFPLDYYRVLAESLEGLKICLPQRTFEDRLTISGSTRQVELLCYGGGHTGSDSFLMIPDEGILFLADLLFVGCHPFLPDGNPKNWIAILERIKGLDADVLVPGHGPLGQKTDLDLMINYIEMIRDIARNDPGNLPSRLPKPFDTWKLDMFYKINFEFMSRRKIPNQ